MDICYTIKFFSLQYIWSKTLKYLKFILPWVLIIGTAEFLITGKFGYLSLLIGAVIGDGRLYHMWFITALLIIYLILHFINNLYIFIIFLTLLVNAEFIICVFSGFEIRDAIPAPLRLLTNGLYFLIGKALHKSNHKVSKYLYSLSIISYLLIFAIPKISVMIWASAYYASLFCITGTVAIF